MAMKMSMGEKVFEKFNYIILTILAFLTVYPFIYIISNSVSSLDAIMKQEVYLLPKGINIDSYKLVFKHGGILTAYYNTIWYTVVGTAISVFLTTSSAYPLSRKTYSIRSQLMVYFAITMYFGGGLVPVFILVNQLGLYNTRWVMVILGAVGVSNMVIARVFFQTNVPEEMTDAARIDGANDVIIYFKIALPLSKAVVAVLTLQYAVSHWNDFFKAMIYLNETHLQPLALYLRRLLIMGTAVEFAGEQEERLREMDQFALNAVSQQFKYASVVITMLPIMCFYPFLQKYFVKGIMVGAIKE
ncbi:MAG TPA: carbohydrate ABC transporter permease [Clostridiales bacterium]|nr:carbohydrate ABC transporter permease [Clostridiales bacterium]